MERELDRLPVARPSSELIVEELPDELLVYDRRRKHAHCLNRTAAMVWRRCDGVTSLEAMVGELEAAGISEGRTAALLALDELERAQLLAPAEAPLRAVGYSRRRMLKNLGIAAGAAIAIPVVQSIVAPSVAEAASCIPSGGTGCAGGTACCSGGTCMGNTCF